MTVAAVDSSTLATKYGFGSIMQVCSSVNQSSNPSFDEQNCAAQSFAVSPSSLSAMGSLDPAAAKAAKNVTNAASTNFIVSVGSEEAVGPTVACATPVLRERAIVFRGRRSTERVDHPA